MIDDQEIARVLGQRLQTLDPLPLIVWENQEIPGDPTFPYLIFEMVKVGRIDPTLNGTSTVERGYAFISIIAEWGQYSTQANALAKRTLALFPYGRPALVGTGGEVSIHKPPETVSGYRDGVYWRLPVKVFYEAS